MESLVFGHAGPPVIVFPTSMGRFYDYEDRGMIAAVGHKYENGELQAFCVDSVDSESWYNKNAHPHDRVVRHAAYDQYIQHEVVPDIRARNSHPGLGVTGCSFGGYHSVAFATRHPELVTDCVSMGGAFDIKQFLDGYYDEDCYFMNPPDFVPNLPDGPVLDALRRMRIVLATGEADICLGDNRRFSHILDRRGIPHWLDVWGNGTGHDWPWWREMAAKFL
jgi:esterase/lipase superfamily enzyme